MIGRRGSSNSGSVLVLNGYAEGWLVKQGGRIKTWHKRFFVFNDGFFSYRKDSRDETKVLRRDTIVDVHYYSKVRNGLCVLLQCGRKLCISAKTEEQMNVWYDVFNDYLMKRSRAQEFQSLHRRKQQPLDPIEECEGSFIEDKTEEDFDDNSTIMSDTDSDTDFWVYDF